MRELNKYPDRRRIRQLRRTRRGFLKNVLDSPHEILALCGTLISFLLLIATTVLGFYSYKQWRSVDGTLDQIRQQTPAVTASAAAAQLSAETARAAFESSERPLVDLDLEPVTASMDESSVIVGFMGFATNVGNKPALGVHLVAAIDDFSWESMSHKKVSPDPCTIQEDYLHQALFPSRLVMSGRTADVSDSVSLGKERLLNRARIERALGGTYVVTLHAHLCVIYSDQQTELRHHTRLTQLLSLSFTPKQMLARTSRRLVYSDVVKVFMSKQFALDEAID